MNQTWLKVSPSHNRNRGIFMAYITSKNLKNKFRRKNHLYILGENNEKVFCEKCRKLSDSNTSNLSVCPNCGLKDTSYRHYCFCYNMYRIDRIIDSININKSIDDNNTNIVHDMNITILFRCYDIDPSMSHIKTYQNYSRIIFNFDTKQIYYTQKNINSKKVCFSHFNIYKEHIFNTDFIFSPMMHDIIKNIYDIYNIPKTEVPFYKKLPKQFKTSLFGFMCLKFPIVTIYMYDKWLTYLQLYGKTIYYTGIIKDCNTIDMHMKMIYWSCNDDKVLKKALTATSNAEYITLSKQIVEKFTSDISVINDKIKNPIFVIYARFMYMLGFRDIKSVEHVINHLMNYDSYKDEISIWFFDMLQKRTHTRNKMYRRFFKYKSETDIITMLENADFRCTYYDTFHRDFFACELNHFYSVLKMHFDKINFSDNINDICNTILNYQVTNITNHQTP